jgi:hypothetical protein
MDHLDIVKFFDEYIKKFPAYSNNNTYSTFIDYISKNFTKELYTNIPLIFKELFENNYINIELYDVLLSNIGIPKNVLSKLSINNKILFFKNLTDYFKYKGNITFFDKVSKLFPYQTFDIYELYIDYDEDNTEWVFKPKNIIRNTTNDLIENSLDFDEIYNKIPSFLINQNQLDFYKSSNNIILPVKSNIILLNYSDSYNINELVNLINATFIKTFGNNIFTCYFLDNQFNISLKEFYLLWYYLLLRFNDTNFSSVPLKFVIEYTEGNNPFSIYDLDDLLDKYNSISNSKDAIDFYKEYLENYFLTYSLKDEINYVDLEYLIPEEILTYINEKLAISVELNVDYNTLLTELLNSLIMFSMQDGQDEYFIKYSEYLINDLTRITFNIKESNSYVLLYNFKPYHTELISSYISKIIINSKLDTIIPYSTKINFLMSLELADSLNNLDYIYQKIVYNYLENNTPIDSSKIKSISIPIINEYILQFSNIFNIKLNNLDYNELIDILLNFRCSLDNSYINLNIIDYNSTNNYNYIVISNLILSYVYILKLNFELQDNLNLILQDSNLTINNYIKDLSFDPNLISDFQYVNSLKINSDNILFNDNNINSFLNFKLNDILITFLKENLNITHMYYDQNLFYDIVNQINNLHRKLEDYLIDTTLKRFISNFKLNNTLNLISNIDTIFNYFCIDQNSNYDSVKKNIIVNYESNFTIIKHRFNFNISTNTLVLTGYNLNNLINLGMSGLNIGDKVKHVNDNDSHYNIIIGFDLINNYIILNSNYTGGNHIGYIQKLNTLYELPLTNLNIFLNDSIMDQSVENLNIVNNYFDQNNLIENYNIIE